MSSGAKMASTIILDSVIGELDLNNDGIVSLWNFKRVSQ